MGDWAVTDCEEVGTPWLVLSGPRTVFILNEMLFSLATAARLLVSTRCEIDGTEMMGLDSERLSWLEAWLGWI